MLKPIGDRVVLKIEEKQEEVGGLLLAASHKDKTKTARVVATGEKFQSPSGAWYEPSVKEGDLVLLTTGAGLEVKDQGQAYLIVSEAEILAIVE